MPEPGLCVSAATDGGSGRIVLIRRFWIVARRDRLGGDIAGNRPEHFVLDLLEERLGLLGSLVVVNRGVVAATYIRLEAPFRGPYFADMCQPLVQIVPGIGVLEPRVIHGETLMDVLFQHIGGPNPELGCPFGVHSIADGDDGMEIKEVLIASNLPPTLVLNSFHFGNSCFAGQFAFAMDICQVLGYDGNIDVKELCHPCLSQPYGLILEDGIDLDIAIGGGI